jgi:hypothetical protein
MTQGEIIEMARQAEFCISPIDSVLLPKLKAFAKLVAQHEREACAELCEMLDVANPRGKSWDEGTIDCANAIRARGNT